MCSEYIIIFDAYNTLKDPTWEYIKSILFSSLPSVLELPLKRWIAVATTLVPTWGEMNPQWAFHLHDSSIHPTNFPIHPENLRYLEQRYFASLSLSLSPLCKCALILLQPTVSLTQIQTVTLWAKVSLSLRSGCVCGGGGRVRGRERGLRSPWRSGREGGEADLRQKAGGAACSQSERCCSDMRTPNDLDRDTTLLRARLTTDKPADTLFFSWVSLLCTGFVAMPPAACSVDYRLRCMLPAVLWIGLLWSSVSTAGMRLISRAKPEWCLILRVSALSVLLRLGSHPSVMTEAPVEFLCTAKTPRLRASLCSSQTPPLARLAVGQGEERVWSSVSLFTAPAAPTTLAQQYGLHMQPQILRVDTSPFVCVGATIRHEWMQRQRKIEKSPVSQLRS